MNRFFSDRTVGFYIGLIACLAALVGVIGLIATDMGDITFSWITIGLMAAGILFECMNGLTDLSFWPLFSALCYGCGLSWHLYIGLPTLSDIWNGVHFIGGNAQAVILFGAFFGIATLLGVVSSFMNQRRNIRIA